ncbi:MULTISPECIES: hypothetical protein [unclassified Streptomyces]|nr:hypothetical protein [Streptomyces sp. NBC_00273]
MPRVGDAATLVCPDPVAEISADTAVDRGGVFATRCATHAHAWT